MQRAIALATPSHAGSILVGLLAPPKSDPEFDRLEFLSSLMAAELGHEFYWYCEPLDEEARARRRYDQVLAPLAALVGAAGLDVRIELLRGAEFGCQLRRLVTRTPHAELVLGNPVKLHDELHDLTGELLLNAPCRLRVEDVDRPQIERRNFWRKLIRR